jgi:hypothetical protein
MTIDRPDQIPAYLEALRKERFYGSIRIVIKNGEILQMTTEQSTLFREGNGTYKHDHRYDNNR